MYKVIIKEVNPNKRFDITSFSSEVNDGKAGALHAVYTCPKCQAKIRFSKENIEFRSKQRHSNLPVSIKSKFDAWAESSELEEFLDWNCPDCKLASRAYVRLWAGGRHGDSGAVIEVVLEEDS